MTRSIVAAVALSVLPALAHDAPSGFTYLPSCCSSTDCRPADTGEVVEKDGGWLVVPSHTWLPANDLRLHEAPDGRFHVCNKVAGDRLSEPWCVYLPSFGS
ncbi:hypothetical protein EZH22_24335 [Xanthobacter dioxanivorans]|uniref:Secreted protein n=1 Tax=Xanthobacter dioxanivorans TaxID=2528964 RepID=A0A974SJ74_9HYPH|nr:hypothetical protein [Xanthobacter dioxanivorans]QRG06083.1 hypothetical protein EZH22_24335 [Xanthobacter dioxanivorans]